MREDLHQSESWAKPAALVPRALLRAQQPGDVGHRKGHWEVSTMLEASPEASCLEATDLWMTAESTVGILLMSQLQSGATHCQLRQKSGWVSHSLVKCGESKAASWSVVLVAAVAK